MAAAPPPYSPRDNRQQWKDWSRAQKQAARAQRYYWRYHHRGSIAGPVILLTVGILALLIETGRMSAAAFWMWYSHWWPMLLIGIGLVLLAEYFFDRNNPYAGRRSMGGFGFLIVVILLAGWGTHAAHVWAPIGDQFSDSDDFWSMMGEEHNNNVSQTLDLAANATLQVQNPRGDVTITASPDAKMHVQAHQVVHSSSDNDARKAFDAVAPKFSGSGSSGVLSVEGRNNARVDLTVQVPSTSTTVINSGRGDVTVQGLKGTVDVTANRGDVKFDGIGGNVHARLDKGDISAHEIAGDVTIDGHMSDVTLSEIKGKVTLDGEFFGDTHLEQLTGAIHFHSSRTDIDIPKLSGDLTMDSGDLNISQPVGPIRVVTRKSKDIDISQLSGDAHIENENGDISLTTVLPLGNIQVSNRNGDLSVTVPENASFSVTASNADGDLRTDFPLGTNGDDDRKSLQGQVGNGGPRLELTTGHGDLQLRKGNSAPPAPPAPPKAPKAPAPPASADGAKHLRVPKDAANEQPTEQ